MASLNNVAVLRRPGAVAAELALLLPFLAFIFLISVDFGRIYYYFLTVDNCARNGAVFGSQLTHTQGWQGSGSQVASIQDAALADAGSLKPALSAANVAVTNGTDSDGNTMVQVTVSYTFQTITNYPGIPSQVNLVRTAQMRVAP